MPRLTRRKGVILVQTLVLSVILAMISVMVMQWVLGRYMTAARTYRSTVSKVHTTAYAFNMFCAWNTGPISSTGNTDYPDADMTSKHVGFISSWGHGGGNFNKIDFDTDKD